MMDDLKRWDKGFTSMQENIDTSTAMGRFVMDIIQRIAQLESEQIGERVYEGMKQKALTAAGSNGFGCPFGYNYKQRDLVIISEEAEIVRTIYKQYLQGWGTSKIALKLMRRGCPTKSGGVWAARSVNKILRNPIYCGFLRWDGIVYENCHEAIIGVRQYNRAQRKLYDNARNYKSRKEPCLIKRR